MGTANNIISQMNYKCAPASFSEVCLSLENVLLPSDQTSKPPSTTHGLDRETEVNLRIIGCELIQTAGILLRLPQVAMATGQLLFQRFYYCKSFVQCPMEVTAMGCVCLASKIEEDPRRIRDVINVFAHIKQIKYHKPIQPMLPDHHYTSLKSQVIKAERKVLKELGFCVHVQHPHKLIMMYLQVLKMQNNRTLMQMAWNYMNDSLRTDVLVTYSPETVACACIYLTARKLRIPLPKNPAWYLLFNVTEADIVAVCQKILDLYRKPKLNQLELERVVEKLRDEYEIHKEKVRTQRSKDNTPSKVNSPVKERTASPPPSRHESRRKRKSDSRSRDTDESPYHHRHHSKKSKRSHHKERRHSKSKDRKSRKKKHSSTPSSSPPRKEYKKKSKNTHYKMDKVQDFPQYEDFNRRDYFPHDSAISDNPSWVRTAMFESQYISDKNGCHHRKDKRNGEKRKKERS